MKFLGEYKPDLPPLLNDGLTRAEGVLPEDKGYAPIPGLHALTTSQIDARAQGLFSARDLATQGTTYTYVGNASKLYQLNNNGWTDVSVGGGYSTGSTERWEFAQWGNQVVATNFTDAVQVNTLGGANFANLGGSPPKARYVGIVKDFLVLGNLDDAVDNEQPQRVQWSGFDDITAWTVSPTTQSDKQNLRNNFGWITGVVGGDYGLIFQEFAITRMTYVGSPLVFQFDLVEHDRGAYAPGSIIPIGDTVAYLASDGFYAFDGRQSIPIGEGKINESFFASSGPIAFDRSYVERVNAAHYPEKQIIAWSYPSVNADPVGVSDVILFYNYSPTSQTRWSVLRTNTRDAEAGTTNIDHYVLGSELAISYTLEGLDNVSSSIDALPYSLDSRVWAGLNKLLGVMDTNNDLSAFEAQSNTDYIDAYLETGEFQLNPEARTSISLVRPFIERPRGNATITMALSGRNDQDVSASFSGTVTLNASGFANIRNNARFHRAFIKIESGFEYAYGINLMQQSKVGRR